MAHPNVNSSGTALGQCTDALPGGNVQDFSYGFNLGTADNGNLASLVATGTASTQTFSRVYGYDGGWPTLRDRGAPFFAFVARHP